jgi:hypothetical protein
MFPRVHFNERITDDIFQKWADVNLAQDEAKRIGVGVAEHDEFVSRQSLVYMELIRRCAIIHELFISFKDKPQHKEPVKEGSPHLPEIFLIMLRKERMTP